MKISPNNFFHFTTGEKKAVRFILGILLLLIVFRISFSFFNWNLPSKNNLSEEDLRIVKFFSEESNQPKNDSLTSLNQISLFNPDTLSLIGWINIGFTEKEANSILKFKKMIGGFDTPEKIKKSYVITDQDYERLIPYMVFNENAQLTISSSESEVSKTKNECYALVIKESTEPVYSGFEKFDSLLVIRENNGYLYCYGIYSSAAEAKSENKDLMLEGSVKSVSCNQGFWIYPNNKKESVTYTVAKLSTVEINSADTTEFKTLTGVGAYYAKKIIAFREKLGGFYKIDQLKEVYGIDPEIVSKNKSRLEIDESKIHKLNINQLSDKDLKKHPYISWQVANSIYFYRLNHGDYKSVDEITKSDVVTTEIFEKLKNYLTVKE